MAVALQQTDSAPNCAATAFCSGRALSGGTVGGAQASEGGTVGTTEDALSIKNGETNVVLYTYECVIPEGYEDATGDWEVNIDVSTGTTAADLTEVHVCRVNSSCVSQESVASLTGLTTALTAGSKQELPNQASAITWVAGDTAQVTLVVSQDAGVHGATSVGITPSLTIVAPGSAGGQQFQQSCPATVSAAPSVVRQTSTTEAAVATAVASTTKAVAVTRSASVAATADLSRRTSKTLSATTANVAAMSPSLVFLQTCAATVAAVAGFSRAISWTQACAAVASVAASIQKQTAKTFTATATGSASIAKRTGKVLAATTSNVAGMTPSLVFLQECAATVSAVATLGVTVAWAQTCAAVVSATASVTKHTAKTWDAVTSNVATLAAVGPDGGGDGGASAADKAFRVRRLNRRRSGSIL